MKQFDFESTASRMRSRARSGEHCGGQSITERAYIKKCRTREGNTTLAFTRDFGQHQFGWLADPAHDRCWHLSIACDDPIERDAWLRAFFGDDLEHVWGQPAVTEYGESSGLWHWRLFCDENWQPLPSKNPGDLLAAHMSRASDLGVAIIAADLAA